MANDKLTNAEIQKRKRKTIRQVRGTFIALLAVIGFLTIVLSAVKWVKKLTSNGDTLEDYTVLVSPLASMDPLPFDDVKNADKNMLTASAIWAAYTNENIAKYNKSETGMLMIPLTDVTMYFKKMYGTEADIIGRQDFSYDSFEYKYDGDTDCFILPSNSNVGAYRGIAVSKEDSGSAKILKVAYLRSEAASHASKDMLSEESVIKYMDYILMKNEDSWCIFAVKTPDE